MISVIQKTHVELVVLAQIHGAAAICRLALDDGDGFLEFGRRHVVESSLGMNAMDDDVKERVHDA